MGQSLVGQHSGIGVLDKAMTVLRAVAEEPCGLAELCARTGLPRATAHRLAVGAATQQPVHLEPDGQPVRGRPRQPLSLIHISEPTRPY